jgi:DNA polymerase III delta subunit
MLTWCRKRAHKYGAEIDDDACEYLAESAEGNLRAIAMEIEKASIFILPETRITLNVVSELSPHYSNIFALLDHWLRKEHELVLSGIQEILAKQPSAIPVFAVIQTSLSKWLTIKCASEHVLSSLPSGRGIQRRELPVADMARRLQTEIKMNPWVLKMELERLQKVSLPYLVEKKKELTRLEKFVKTGMLTDIHALTIFFAKEDGKSKTMSSLV